MFVAPDNEKLSYSGRIDFENPKEPLFIFPATSVTLRFRGSGISVKVKNKNNYWDNYLGVIIDGKQNKYLLSNNEAVQEITLATDLDNTDHEILLFKRQDSCHVLTFQGFEINGAGEVLAPLEKPKRRMEFFGDSVSAGEVSEAEDFRGQPDPQWHKGEFSNSYFSYAWMTARKLDAEIHDTAQGGIALLDGTGWFNEPDYLGMESCFDKLQYNPAFGEMKQWDFEKYTPQVVVIAIGQNDNHPLDYMKDDPTGEKALNWKKHYKKFVEDIRDIYKDATIILTTTILEHDKKWDDAIEGVCQEIKDDKLHHFLYSKNGIGTPGHIRKSEADEMSDELSKFITDLGDEIWNLN